MTSTYIKPTCKKCSSHNILTIEIITGTADVVGLTIVGDDVHPDFDGETEIDYGASVTDGYYCDDCYWQTKNIKDLIPGATSDETTSRCDNCSTATPIDELEGTATDKMCQSCSDTYVRCGDCTTPVHQDNVNPDAPLCADCVTSDSN